MALLIVSVGCSIGSLTSERYAIIDGTKEYGIYEGAMGGSGCLGQCKDDSANDETACILFKLFPSLVSVCACSAFLLLLLNFTNSSTMFYKEIAIVVLISVGFVLSIVSILVQILVPVIDNKCLIDLSDDGRATWGEGFNLTVITIAAMGLTLILQIFNSLIIFIPKSQSLIQSLELCCPIPPSPHPKSSSYLVPATPLEQVATLPEVSRIPTS
jgi:hypothetical protein